MFKYPQILTGRYCIYKKSKKVLNLASKNDNGTDNAEDWCKKKDPDPDPPLLLEGKHAAHLGLQDQQGEREQDKP